MEHLNKTILLAVLALAISGCGVKGRPLPPLNPAPLGRGEPTFKDATTTTPTKKKTTASGTEVVEP
ncbi:hypothetical protein EZJ49_05480 [Bdellovibrio bacteriovorus]|uniref:hypothetical protein n=1 Tax=Bdellovibrio bacteriovorus TaxID=959 RepID=UPI0021D23A97|nr:hypothetical protein [Bdellovibrio bacteriovorus]UXR65698.1 hypothetical protein EZJ49_05480 [Bdellovibrio bacteriovorus]